MSDVYIISAVRTPIGSFNGSLSIIPTTKLGSIVIADAIKKASIEPNIPDHVIMGNVLPSGLGQAPARQCALGAGLPKSTNCLTINKVCGSGLKAVMLAAQAISLGDAEVVIAGGMENMSRAPYILEKARTGYRLGDGTIIDSMIKDGLWDVYNNFHMGSAAEIIADRFNFSRQQLDEYSLGSYDRTLNAQKNGHFNEEIVQIDISTKKENPKFLKEDEEPKKLNREKLTHLQPAFKEDGKLTAGNSSSISDGAAAVVLTSEAKAKKLGIRPFAKILGYSESGLSPELFSLAPINAIEDVLKKTKLTLSNIDLFEINEAFASSSLAVNKELNLDPKKVNISGGAIALGHPIGASGARILTTLLYNLKRTHGKHGIASLCIGGGEAVAMAVEMV